MEQRAPMSRPSDGLQSAPSGARTRSLPRVPAVGSCCTVLRGDEERRRIEALSDERMWGEGSGRRDSSLGPGCGPGGCAAYRLTLASSL